MARVLELVRHRGQMRPGTRRMAVPALHSKVVRTMPTTTCRGLRLRQATRVDLLARPTTAQAPVRRVLKATDPSHLVRGPPLALARQERLATPLVPAI